MPHFLLLSAIAMATGETLRTVERMGFRHASRMRRDQPIKDDPVAVIDCPCCGGAVVLAWERTDELPEFADCRRCETVFPYFDSEIYETDLLAVPVLEPRTYAPSF